MSERRTVAMTVLRLAVASLAIGLVLSLLGVTPVDILQRTADLAVGVWGTLVDVLGWAGSYMLLGALVVLPLWGLAWLWRRLRGGEGSRGG